MAERDRLKLRWEELCKSLGVSKDMEMKWWDVLETRYTESQRAYHTLSHLDEMFGYFQEHFKLISDAASVSLAIFFHDVIYDPRSGSPQNEIDSADVFEDFVQEALPTLDLGRDRGFRATKVKRWIVQTAHHKCTEDDEMDCKLFMDFDMAVLGRPWQQYEVYSQQIRQEYSHVPEALYCTARSAFLASASDGDSKSNIFATDIFRSQRETQAIENASLEAEMLRAKLDRCSLVAKVTAATALRLKAFASRAVFKKAGASILSLLAGSAIVAAPVHAMMGVGLPVSAAAGCLGLQLGTSTYIRQPLPTSPDRESGLVVIAGSYNPPHHGHLEMVRYLSSRYERVHAVIGVNPHKKYVVSPYERQELFREMLKELGLSNVKVVIAWSYIWKHAQRHGAKVMYRGLRSFQKDGAAEMFLEAQNISGQLLLGRVRPIPTAYIQADPRFSMVSSTLIRERLKCGDSISELVPPGCVSLVEQCYAEKIA